MPFNEDEAKALLMDLVKRPDVPTVEIGPMYKDIITFHNELFPLAVVVEVKKKKRRRSTSPNTGWPSGVNRVEYNAWKAKKQAGGQMDNLNPHVYKAERDGTPMPPPTTSKPRERKPAAPAATAPAKPAETKPAAAAKPAETKPAAAPAATKPAAPAAAPAKPATPVAAKPSEPVAAK